MARAREHTSPHEDALIRAFIAPGRQEQFLRRVANPKTRGKILKQLAHFEDLDHRFAHRLPPGEQKVDEVYCLLRGKGAPDRCYVMGESRLDGREVDLREALEEIFGVSFGNFLSCIPGKLGYFGGEGQGERYILER